MADIGGSFTRLGIVKNRRIIKTAVFPSKSIKYLKLKIKQFTEDKKITRACFAVAGVVSKSSVKLTNRPWKLSTKDFPFKVKFVNDVEAIAYSLNSLKSKDLVAIAKAKPKSGAAKCIITCGTGVGKAIAVPSKNGFIGIPSEGGACDLPFKSAKELNLLKDFKTYESLLSSKGIVAFYNSLIPKNLPEVLSSKDALRTKNEYSEEVRRVFNIFLARCTRNFALDSLSLGGVYLSGGILSHNPRLLRKGFLKEFHKRKERNNVLSRIPVFIIKNEFAGLIGASSFL